MQWPGTTCPAPVQDSHSTTRWPSITSRRVSTPHWGEIDGEHGRCKPARPWRDLVRRGLGRFRRFARVLDLGGAAAGQRPRGSLAGTTAAKDDWKKLVATMEQSLRLHRHKPLTLIEWAPYLHARTGGMIGSLDQLIYEAANDAISDGTEKITKAHLDAVILDIAAGNQYEARRKPRE